MKKKLNINEKIKSFNKTIKVNGDKSISIRWLILSSLALGRSRSINLLKSEDVLSTIECLKKLGVKITLRKNVCEVHGKGINGLNYKKNLVLNAGNSGTLSRLLFGLLIKTPFPIKIVGDKSLSLRDFKRVIVPIKKFGANFTPKNNFKLPIKINGTNYPSPIFYKEDIGSAQIKTCILLAALNTPGVTKILTKYSRDHTERLLKYLKVPIKIFKIKKKQLIQVEGKKSFGPIDYRIPSDPSSGAFFIVLTILSKKSSIKIRNLNINSTRIGFIKILNSMGAKIKFFNKRNYKGEQVADVFCKSNDKLKSINISKNFNISSAIDEFLLIFICCGFAKGVSKLRGLKELNKKESKRLDWGIKILKMVGIKAIKLGDDGIKIFGNPNLSINKKYVIKNFLKDHRVAMTSAVLALSKGGDWQINDPESIKTSFPDFLNIAKSLGAKINEKK